jgi:hypothetical protein
MLWIKGNANGQPPELTDHQALPVLISSHFLQMDLLVRQCLQYIARRLVPLTLTGSDTAALGADLTQMLANVRAVSLPGCQDRALACALWRDVVGCVTSTEPRSELRRTGFVICVPDFRSLTQARWRTFGRRQVREAMPREQGHALCSPTSSFNGRSKSWQSQIHQLSADARVANTSILDPMKAVCCAAQHTGPL